MNEDIEINNSLLIKKKSYVNDKRELDRIISELNEINRLREESSDKYIYDLINNDKFNYLMYLIRRGIKIEIDDYYFNLIVDNICSFFKKYDIKTSKSEIENRLKNIEFFVSDINLGYGGKGVCVFNRIGIDLSYVVFSSEGKFIGFKKEEINFMIHAFTHEFLHFLSSKNYGRYIFEDAINEGFTDMFAHLISKQNEIKGNYYFLEKICLLFTEIIGTKEMLNEYLFENETRPLMKKLFFDCGGNDDDYLYFSNCFINVLRETRKNNNNKDNCTHTAKTQCLEFVINKVLIPYINNNPLDAERVLEKFNLLFNEFWYLYDVNLINNAGKRK